MDLMKLATDAIFSKLGGNTSESGIASALSGLIGGDSNKGGLDLSGMVSGMLDNKNDKSGGLSDIVGSWLGDGDNKGVSVSQITEMLGGDKISAFANKLGIDEKSAAESLTEALPQMVDKGSNGGSLLDSFGGLGGVLDMAKKFL